MEKRLKSKVGLVVSDKMNKTVVVRVESLRHHMLYKKTVRYKVKFKAHDENSACRVGDIVRIVQTRPLSKEKRWRVAEVLTRKELPETPMTEPQA